MIGAGYFGALHAQKYAALDGVRLVAVCDIDARRAAAVAKATGAEPVTDHRRLFGKVDAVSVVVPTVAHFAVARDFLDAGVHVLVEKPICDTLEQADALIALAREKGLLLQVGHLERFSPMIEALVTEADRPRYIESERISSYRGRGTDTTVILDMMIHDIDHILQLVRSPIERIDAVGVPVVSPAEDIANARIRFENGCVATVTASRVSWKISRKIRVFQHDAYITLDMAAQHMLVARRTGGGDGEPMMLGADEKRFDKVDLLQLQAASFLDCIRDGRPSRVPAESVRPVLAAALEITEQLRVWRREVD